VLVAAVVEDLHARVGDALADAAVRLVELVVDDVAVDADRLVAGDLARVRHAGSRARREDGLADVEHQGGALVDEVGRVQNAASHCVCEEVADSDAHTRDAIPHRVGCVSNAIANSVDTVDHAITNSVSGVSDPIDDRAKDSLLALVLAQVGRIDGSEHAREQ